MNNIQSDLILDAPLRREKICSDNQLRLIATLGYGTKFHGLCIGEELEIL